MDTYASLSLHSINYFSPANKHVFPQLCGPLGITDADQYCATKTSEVCCGLCPNQSVNGPGQFVWAIVSYAIAAFTYTLAPSEVWGVAVMQVVNANAFIGTGLVRVVLGAVDGGMTRYHTLFLWPQALGFIYIMAPAIFAPSWSRLGSSQKDMEARVRERTQQSPHEARHADVREVEKIMYKRHHDYWSYPIFAFWIVNMSAWTGLYVWVSVADIEFSQSNCEDVIDYILSPHVVTIILGVLAWLLVAFDGFLLLRKEKQGGSDFIIDTFLSKGKDRSMKEHRRLERKITIGVTLSLLVLWLFLNCWLWIEGLNKFYLSGADWMTFGQVEQVTALFPDLLALVAGISGYLSTRTDLRLSRAEVKSHAASKRASVRASMQTSRKGASSRQDDGDGTAQGSSRHAALLHGLSLLRTGSHSRRTGASTQHPASDDEGHTSSGGEDVRQPSRRSRLSSRISPLDRGEGSSRFRRGDDGHDRNDLYDPPAPLHASHDPPRSSRDGLPSHAPSSPHSADHDASLHGLAPRSRASSFSHGLPRPERGSLITLRDELGLAGSTAHAEVRATGHDERSVQESLAKGSRSMRRWERTSKGERRFEEAEERRRRDDNGRGWR